MCQGGDTKPKTEASTLAVISPTDINLSDFNTIHHPPTYPKPLKKAIQRLSTPKAPSWLNQFTSLLQTSKTQTSQSKTKRSLISDISPKITKSFKSREQMVASGYFRNENRLGNVVAQIEGSENYYEIKPSGEQDKLGIIAIETNLGSPQTASLLDQPITPCAFAESQKLSVSFSKSSSFSQSFTHRTTLEIKGAYKNEVVNAIFSLLRYAGYNINLPSSLVNLTVNIGGTLQVGIERSTGHSFGGSITCDSGPGGIVQLFTSLRYIYYPDAQSRVILFDEKTGQVQETGPWETAFSSDDYPQYGLIFYDNSKGADYACVNDREQLLCDSEIPLKVFTPDFDPAIGLHRAMTA